MPLEQVAVAGGVMPVEWQGDGPAIIMLHGWALDRRMWRPQFADLSCDYRVLAPDRRGFGENRLPPDMARELDDIDALLDHFGLEACLLGMSQGGRVALRYAAKRPSRLKGLILQGAPLDGFQPEARGEEKIPIADYRQWAEAGRMDAIRKAWRDHMLMTVPADRPDLRSLLDVMLASYRGMDLLVAAPTAMPDLAARLADIPTPTLALTGEDDSRWLHLAADALAYGLPQCRKQVLADGGHLVNLTNPSAYNAAIRAFLSDIG